MQRIRKSRRAHLQRRSEKCRADRQRTIFGYRYRAKCISARRGCAGGGKTISDGRRDLSRADFERRDGHERSARHDENFVSVKARRPAGGIGLHRRVPKNSRRHRAGAPSRDGQKNRAEWTRCHFANRRGRGGAGCLGGGAFPSGRALGNGAKARAGAKDAGADLARRQFGHSRSQGIFDGRHRRDFYE